MDWVRTHPFLTVLAVLGIIVALYLFSYLVFNTGESITESAALLR